MFSVFHFDDVQLRNGKSFFYKMSSFWPESEAPHFGVVVIILAKEAKGPGFKSRMGNNFFPLFSCVQNIIFELKLNEQLLYIFKK